jgi:hypothetical protein
MNSIDDQNEFRKQLLEALFNLEIPRNDHAKILSAFEDIAHEYQDRLIEQAQSPKVSDFITTMDELRRAVRTVNRVEVISLPELNRDVFKALRGRYPASATDLVPVTPDMLRANQTKDGIVESSGWSGPPRAYITGQPATPHILAAALYPAPEVPHLVRMSTDRTSHQELQAYLFADLSVDTAPVPALQEHLEQAIREEPEAMLELVEWAYEAVNRTLKDPSRQNSGQHTLFSWAGLRPGGRLVADVCQVLWEVPLAKLSRSQRQGVRSIINVIHFAVAPRKPDRIRDDIADSRHALEKGENSKKDSDKVAEFDEIRDDVLSGMISAWHYMGVHLRTADYLWKFQERMDKEASRLGGNARHRRERLKLRQAIILQAYDTVVLSLKELKRRVDLGDHIGSDSRISRSSGIPTPILDLVEPTSFESRNGCWRKIKHVASIIPYSR